MIHRLAAAFLALLACLTLPAPAWAGPVGPLVLAASSLQESLSAAADRWAAKGHARPVLSFAASSALARQVEAGAPADLFLSADEEWMDALASKGLLRAGTRVSFLTNQLVLIAPKAGKARLAIGPRFPLARALAGGRLAMADPAAVPAGRYGKAALVHFRVWPTVAAKIAPAENVRAALALVERGEAPLGIVFATDARAAPGVRVIAPFPATSHPPITYPVAVLKSARHPEAEGFRRVLISREGKTIFVRYGFGTR
jgi:molybdate transport system substrate-binding protein